MRDTFHSIHLVSLPPQLLLWVGRFPMSGLHMQEIPIGILMLVQSHTITKFQANLYTLGQLMYLLLTMVVIWVLVCNPRTSHTCDILHPRISGKTTDMRATHSLVYVTRFPLRICDRASYMFVSKQLVSLCSHAQFLLMENQTHLY